MASYVIISDSELQALGDEGYIDYQPDLYLKNPKYFQKICFMLGADTQFFSRLEVDTLQHRNKLGQVVQCNRYVWPERQDKAWVHSKYASMDVLYDTADKETQRDMREMSKQSKFIVKKEEV
jgi:hypothetical protein